MKTITKIIIAIITIFTIFYLNNEIVLAKTSAPIVVTVTEAIPWVCEWGSWWTTCTVQRGFNSVMQMMWKIIKYFTFIAALWWVLFIVINWILYSMWWMEQSMKDEAKKRIVQTLIWLILLLMSWVILHAIAPWIYT